MNEPKFLAALNTIGFLGAFETAIEAFEVKRSEGGKKHDPEISGKDLVEILLSRPLQMQEQYFLAQFFSGEIHKQKRRGQPKLTQSSSIVQAVARHYLARLAVGHKKTAIYQEIEERFELKKSAISRYLKLAGKDQWDETGTSDQILDYGQKEIAEWVKSK